ncbi:MAG: BlaI/MecI/CopY family transcriptional regulator [Oscillospiraceae bacterium]|nr:BlaI/MecI/CopY family transcriptional regulator [Oscillospiraceae bacterium]
MKKNITIADSELPIMKILWEKGTLTSPQIFENMHGNKSTLKTLLQRLVTKGAVTAKENTSRTYLYTAAVTQQEYINSERKSFLQKAFDGSAKKMLLNFVQEEKITKEELQQLIDMIEEG